MNIQEFENDNRIQKLISDLYDEADQISEFSEFHKIAYKYFMEKFPEISFSWAHRLAMLGHSAGVHDPELFSAALDYECLFRSYFNDILEVAGVTHEQ